MDEFPINFNIFGKYSYFDTLLKAELLSPVKKRQREDSSTEEGSEAKRHNVLDDGDIDKIENINGIKTHCAKLFYRFGK